MMHRATGQCPGAGEGSPGMWLDNCYSRTDAGMNDHLTEEELSLGRLASGDTPVRKTRFSTVAKKEICSKSGTTKSMGAPV